MDALDSSTVDNTPVLRPKRNISLPLRIVAYLFLTLVGLGLIVLEVGLIWLDFHFEKGLNLYS